MRNTYKCGYCGTSHPTIEQRAECEIKCSKDMERKQYNDLIKRQSQSKKQINKLSSQIDVIRKKMIAECGHRNMMYTEHYENLDGWPTNAFIGATYECPDCGICASWNYGDHKSELFLTLERLSHSKHK